MIWFLNMQRGDFDMVAKHTPGPWKMWTTSAPHAPVVIYTGETKPRLNADGFPEYAPGSFIAEVSVRHGEDGEDNSNARLIAAAPELLEVLETIVRKHSDLIAPDLPEAEAAIAKARRQV
jgi:hypothetical protein